MHVPLHKKACDFAAVSGVTAWWALLACLWLQKLGCCGMCGNDGCSIEADIAEALSDVSFCRKFYFLHFLPLAYQSRRMFQNSFDLCDS